ncbi:homocysteine S-methyltransferase [Pseudarthrobacter siccitolerans]|uniref:Homocysteine S-methyltransferase n=1 Tax=Pseudarthrobacter siccitolerans TaxID=861266 RepID=A0A024H788_9MICC|nr:homocysteine S-methyltransferase [Pseudarthrobacter siccitolerans]CCQ47863.1 homocysteine S-methyltransferase [Pseudarthrobacter siccitolerans]
MPRNNALSRLLDAGENLVLDGALATELEAYGCNLEDPLWSAKVLLEQPGLVKQVHLDYFRAGARAAITASYQATPLGFARRGISAAEALDRVALSVRLADEARREYLAGNPAAGPLLVAGSVGPYGAYLADGSEYRGDYTLSRDEFLEFHRPRVAALVEAGADVLACETLPSLPEAEALLELIAGFGVESWLTFTLRDGAHISDGTPLEQVAQLCDAEPLVAAIGVNCVPLELVTPALEALGRATGKPLIAYPNSGETYDAATKTWGPAESSAAGTGAVADTGRAVDARAVAGNGGAAGSGRAPASLVEGVREWQERGARLVGGCCRTTPHDIAALAQLWRP